MLCTGVLTGSAGRRVPHRCTEGLNVHGLGHRESTAGHRGFVELV